MLLHKADKMFVSVVDYRDILHFSDCVNTVFCFFAVESCAIVIVLVIFCAVYQVQCINIFVNYDDCYLRLSVIIYAYL